MPSILKKLVRLTLFIMFILLITDTAMGSELEYSIFIPCKQGEHAFSHYPHGEYIELGKVLAVPGSTRWPSYTATKWGQTGTVCASAVNAVHILYSIEKGIGRTFSILPGKTFAPAAGKGNAFVIESQAGTGIFGALAPVVGSRVNIVDRERNASKINLTALSNENNYLVISVPREKSFFVLDIENHPGGRVIVWNDLGATIVARVIRPLGGVGRFGGTQFQDCGRVRANHTGVIDISTSPYGQIGGFQIIPLVHAFSKEMFNSWKLTQWMIIAPLKKGSSLAGKGPLFSDNLFPGTQTGKSLGNIWTTYGRKPLVMCRLNGGKWERLPYITGRKDSALKELTHLRIYFPNSREPLLR